MTTQETWKFINTFAPWLSAIGTISAVALSLHLARRDKNVRLEVSAGHRIMVTQAGDSEEPSPEYLFISIVNVGHREAQLTNIGWKAGIFKKKHAIQTIINNEYSNTLPIRLKDGEEARYLIPLEGDLNWLHAFTNDMLSPLTQLQCRFVKIQAFTSIGKTFESNIEKSLKIKIIEKYNEIKNP